MRAKLEELHGVDILRGAFNVFNCCNETFNQRFSTEELVKLYRAFYVCGWDITPDHWTDRQVIDALLGCAPQWDDNEKPVYPPDVKAHFVPTGSP